MVNIGILAEGYTDQLVLEQVLLSSCLLDDEPIFNFVQPLQSAPLANGSYAPGGWTVLFQALKAGKHREALAFNDLLVIHVDTDVCDHIGFDVNKNVESSVELIAKVRERLCEIMGDNFCESHADRVMFAIAVDEVECWFLPLLFAADKAKRRKETGCLEAVDRQLRAKKASPLRSGDGKDPKAYRQLAEALGKRLDKATDHQPSLAKLVTDWKTWQVQRTSAA